MKGPTATLKGSLYVFLILASVAILRAQTPTFDVAAIKQNKSGEENGGYRRRDHEHPPSQDGKGSG